MVTGNTVTMQNVNVGTVGAVSTALCTGASKVLGGGVDLTQGSGQFIGVDSSRPNTTPTATGWTATAVSTTKANNVASYTAYVICGS